MSKITIKEKKVIREFIGSLFKAIGTRRAKKDVIKKISKDPVIKQSLIQINKIDQKLEKYLDKKMKDPNFVQDMEDLGIPTDLLK